MSADIGRERGWSSRHTETRIRREDATAASAQRCAYCWGAGFVLDRHDIGYVRETCPACLGIGSWWPAEDEA